MPEVFEWNGIDMYLKRVSYIFKVPALDSTGVFPFLQRMEARYHKVPTPKKSRAMRQKIHDEGLEKLALDSERGPLNAFNSCKLHNINCHYVNTT